jgi:hypothetical protein
MDDLSGQGLDLRVREPRRLAFGGSRNRDHVHDLALGEVLGQRLLAGAHQHEASTAARDTSPSPGAGSWRTKVATCSREIRATASAPDSYRR